MPYDFTQLSPLDFENLVRDICNDAWAWDLRSFAPGPDRGVDLRCTFPDGTRVIVQCKHTPHAKKAKVVSLAVSEASRSDTPDMDRYLLATSAELTADALDAVRDALSPLPVPDDGVLARSRLNQLLSESVEKRHFKLWLTSSAVLDRVLHAAVFARADALREEMVEAVPRWVDVPAYERALGVLEREQVAILTGPPGVGKSTVAQMLLLSSANEGWQVVPVAGDLKDAWAMLRGDERQIFFYDDFLGSASFAETRGEETSDIVAFVNAVRRRGGDHKRVVLTTRTQVLAQAREAGNEAVDRLPMNVATCVVALAEMSRFARARVLFNHVYFGLSEDNERAALAFEPRLVRAVDHPNFSPRSVELVVQRNTRASELLDDLERTLNNPDELWRSSYKALPRLAQMVLLTLASLPGSRVTERTLRNHVRLDEPGEWDTALAQTEGTWIRIDGSGTEATVAFANPSCRDYVLAQLDSSAVATAMVRSARTVSQLAVLGALAGDVRERPGGLVFIRRALPQLHEAMIDPHNDLAAVLERCAAAELAAAAVEVAAGRVGEERGRFRFPRRTVHSDTADIIRDVLRLAVTYGLSIGRFQLALAAFTDIVRADATTDVSLPVQVVVPCLPWIDRLAVTPDAQPWRVAAVTVAELMVADASTLDDLERLVDIPCSFREHIDVSNVHDVIAAVERDLFADALDDGHAEHDIEQLERAADAFEYGLDVQDLRQRAEALPPWVPSDSHVRVLSTPDDDSGVGAEDDTLRALFARLG